MCQFVLLEGVQNYVAAVRGNHSSHDLHGRADPITSGQEPDSNDYSAPDSSTRYYGIISHGILNHKHVQRIWK